MGQTFANRIREACRGLARSGEFGGSEIAHAAGLQTYMDKRRMHVVLRDMRRRGEVRVVARGRYAYARTAGSARKQEVMWRLLRARRRVTVDDLVELAEVSRAYAREWLRALARQEVIRKIEDRWLLLADSVEMPKSTDNAEKLRLLRQKRAAAYRTAQEALAVAAERLQAARDALRRLGEEDEENRS